MVNIFNRFCGRAGDRAATLRIGAIDSASAGLTPLLLNDFRQMRPDVVVQLIEDKAIRLLPRVLSGRMDKSTPGRVNALRHLARLSAELTTAGARKASGKETAERGERLPGLKPS